MDKKNLDIKELKNVLVTKDVKSGNGNNLKVKNYFFAKNLTEESKREGYFLNLKFNKEDINLAIDNTYYDSPKINDIVEVFKDWKCDMYFEYDNHIYNAPLHKLFKNGDGFQTKLFVGLITQLDDVEHSLEVGNYRHTMKNMGV